MVQAKKWRHKSISATTGIIWAPATAFLRSTAHRFPEPVRLNDGDLIEVCGVRLNFIIRE
jgi:hypothetical protein